MNYALALASGLLLVLLFPRFELTFLAPVALTPALLAMARETRAKHRFLAGWSAGIVFWASVCYWIQFVLEVHGGMGTFGSWGAFTLFALAKGLHFGTFALLGGWLIHRPAAILTVPALWAGLERTHATFGFPWLTLGDAAIGMELPLRAAPLVGVHGVSFVLAVLNVAIALVLLRRPRREVAPAALVLMILLLPPLPAPEPATQSLLAVQPNVAGDTEWSWDLARRLQTDLSALSRPAGETKPDLIAWPEMPAPLYYDTDDLFAELARRIPREAGVPFLFSGVTYTRERQPLNSALLLDATGREAARYHKINLVPFGEFIPPLFAWVNRITQEAGDFAPGSAIALFPVAGRRAGVFICYEAAFPHFIRRFAAVGADVFFNLSNDGYFGGLAAREQHLQLARMRAIENARWLVRPTNNGFTVSIDPAGRVVASAPPDQRLAVRLPFSYRAARTPYTAYGDWFAWTCLAGALGALAFAIPRR